MAAPLRRSFCPLVVQLESRDVPTFFGNQIFPLDNPWNQRITDAPIAANSNAIIGRITNRSGNVGLHPDWGNPAVDPELWGIPINVVDGRTTPAVPLLIGAGGWANESDLVPIPIPANAVLEGDGVSGPNPPNRRGDSHLLVYDKAANILYETWATTRPTDATFPDGAPHTLGQWGAYAEAVWDLNTNTFRTLGWTSADAAGLPVMPGLVRPDEALPPAQGGQGVITHAIRMTLAQIGQGYTYPASHLTGGATDPDLPVMGTRLRLKAGTPIPSNWSPEVKAVAQAMKDYGLIVADTGSDMYFQGVPSTQWDMSAMLQLGQITASDFEVVDLTPVVTGLSASSGSTTGGTSVTITGHNFSGAAGQLRVFFGTTAATSITIVSDSQVIAVTPAHASGTVDVTVRSGTTKTDSDGDPVFFGYGTSAVTPADWFTFSTTGTVPPPPAPPPPAPPPPASPPPPVLPTHPPGGPGGGPSGFVGTHEFAVGSGDSGRVRLYDASGNMTGEWAAFTGAMPGGVRTAAADFNGDGVADVVVGTGPGTATLVRVLDGKTGGELFAMAPFEAAFTGGVYVAAGDMTGDGVPDVVVTPDEGGGPRVLVFRGGDWQKIADFFGIDDPAFRGGARAALGDLNGDHVDDLVISAGFGGGPRVAAFDGRSVAGSRVKLFADFFLFEPALRNGAFVAVGDLDGDGHADLIGGGGPGGGPRVFALSGGDLLNGAGGGAGVLANFFAGNTANRGGIRVTAKDLDRDGRADLVVGDGAGAGSRVTAYLGKGFTGGPAPEAFGFEVFGGAGGVFVG